MSSSTTTASPQWPHPRTPLPPHRLAKLANALGVSTPVPAMQPFMPVPCSTRSPSPSALYSQQSFSKFLLHVIPPLHLPHESDASDISDLTPPPSNASGYHTQFRRGTLVPLHPTLQSQLSAIAKEYALPSTAGLILYLILSNQSPSIVDQSDPDEPGPRLSEDVWKHLWARVLQVEREQQIEISSRSNSPFIHGLGIRLTGRSSPHLPQDLPQSRSTETPESQAMAYPFTPGPSAPSSPSDMRSNSAPPPSSVSQPNTLDPSQQQADRLHLPGLHASSIIPILAKVEFDIDRRRAAWYEPWLRSRRMNHAKRAESQMSRQRAQSRSGDDGSITGESETVASADERKAPLNLKLLGGAQTPSPVPSSIKDDLSEDEAGLGAYDRISESPDELDSHSDGELDQASTTRLGASKDPLADVFGTDEDTWAELHADPERRNSVHPKDPYVVDLALNAAELAALPDGRILTTDEYEEDSLIKEENEVNELLAAMSRPLLSVSIPSSAMVINSKHGSPTTTTGSSRKQVPPSLVIHGLPGSLSRPSSTDYKDSSILPSGAEGTQLAYLRSANSHVDDSYDTIEEEAAFQKTRSPLDDRRGGAVFEDLDLGLEDSEANIEFDENDPDDHRKSQYLMKAQLDELEKHLAEFSPRRLKTDLDDDASSDSRTNYSPGFTSLSPHNGTKNTDVFPLTPVLATSSPEPETCPPQATSAAWPAIPFSSLTTNEVAGGTNAVRPNGHTHPNPRLVIGSGTNPPSKPSSQDGGSSTESISKETAVRKRELEERASYLTLMPPVRLRDTSPIIPLSPDPFGRYPSHIDTTNSGSRQSSVYWEPTPTGRSTPQSENLSQRSGTPMNVSPEQPRHSAAASRFSVDSDVVPDSLAKTTNRSTLMTVKSIKRLWRRSKSSISVPLPAGLTPPPASPQPSDEFDVPKPPKPTRPPSPLPGNWPPKPKTESSLENFHFDQESPYPVRRPSHSSPRPPTAAPPPSTTALSPSASVPATTLPSKSLSAPSTPSVPATTTSSATTPPSALSTLDKEREKSAPKSILRKSRPQSSSSSTSDARPSIEKSAPREFVRLRRANGRLSASPDIPPSPPIPEQFVQRMSSEEPRLSARPKRTPSSSVDSHSPPQARGSRPPSGFPPRRSSSLASSRASEEGHPSFDVSQFEMVSSKVDSTLSYPYHGLDHD